MILFVVLLLFADTVVAITKSWRSDDAISLPINLWTPVCEGLCLDSGSAGESNKNQVHNSSRHSQANAGDYQLVLS